MGTDFIDIVKASKNGLVGYAWVGLRLLRCWGSSRTAQGCWRLVEARDAQHSTAREWTGRSKVGCGLWVCVPEGRAGLRPRVKMRRLQ